MHKAEGTQTVLGTQESLKNPSITVDGSHRHVDASLGRDGFYLTDQDYQALSGAEWSAEDYPACGEKN